MWKRLRGFLLRMCGLPLAVLLVHIARSSDARLGVALVYHGVGDRAGNPRHQLAPSIRTPLFATQVRHLRRNYRLVTASELLDAVRDRRRRDPFPVAITFDDDLTSHVDTAAPVLASAGATATFYISGASLDRPHRFWWELLQDAVDRGLDLESVGLGHSPRAAGIHALGRTIQEMTPAARHKVVTRLRRLTGPDPPQAGLRADSLRRLAASGVEIGFHTLRHDALPALDDEALANALREGRVELEGVVALPLATISYPHGLADPRVAAAARAAGFSVGFTGRPTVVTPRSEPLLLGRVSPSYDSLGELAFDVASTLWRGTLSGRAPATPARPDRLPPPRQEH
jgi:peptidoglycan/xylan/chitin deacetylase (PgdA/CDA1 family)